MHAQALQEGCIEASFGIDADNVANVSLYGDDACNPCNADDWFLNSAFPGTGIGVIDTVDGFSLSAALSSGSNISHSAGMTVLPNSLVNGNRFIDAVYLRDYYGGSLATDLTSFTNASRNGEDPEDWNTGSNNVSSQNDLIDCYTHLRRDGASFSTSDLWLMGGFSRVSNTDSSYVDLEFFANAISYDFGSSSFTSTGTAEGHTAWEFDGLGNISTLGDLIVSVEMKENAEPDFQIRIWISRNDFNNITPSTFTFGTGFDGASATSTYGYAEILSPANSACGVTNNNNSLAPPWGTINSSGAYSTFYQSNQFTEIAVNLTDFGIDPRLIPAIDVCDIPFSSGMFKSRASASFTAQLNDFTGPFSLNTISAIPASIIGDTLTCASPVATLEADSLIPNAIYTWTTDDGSITSASVGTSITVDEPGTYYLAAQASLECNAIRDTFEVTIDTIPPVANITFDTLIGCNDLTTRLYAWEAGMRYVWTGPNSFISTNQVVDVIDEGIYNLLVVDPNNGCFSRDSIYVIHEPCESSYPPDVDLTEVIDLTPPNFTAPLSLIIDCSLNPDSLELTGDVTDESDDCDTDIGEAIYVDSLVSNFPCSGQAIIYRRWQLTDDCGNLRTREQIIVLNDTVPPSFTIPPDITLDCSIDFEDLALSGNVSPATDNCDGGIGAPSYSDNIIVDATCGSRWTIERTWTLADNCGNLNEQIQTISLIDTIAPTFDLPPDITITCTTDENDLDITGRPSDLTDVCVPDSAFAVYFDAYVEVCPGEGVISRTWVASDRCGNVSSATQSISVIDTVPPVITLTDTVTVVAVGVPPCSCVSSSNGLTWEVWRDISGSQLEN